MVPQRAYQLTVPSSRGATPDYFCLPRPRKWLATLDYFCLPSPRKWLAEGVSGIAKELVESSPKPELKIGMTAMKHTLYGAHHKLVHVLRHLQSANAKGVLDRKWTVLGDKDVFRFS